MLLFMCWDSSSPSRMSTFGWTGSGQQYGGSSFDLGITSMVAWRYRPAPRKALRKWGFFVVVSVSLINQLWKYGFVNPSSMRALPVLG